MDILKRIDELRKERGWSVFELTNRANLSEYTIYSWFKRGSKPTVYALENVCDALGVTMAEFFTEIDLNNLSPDEVGLLQSYCRLKAEQKELVFGLVKCFEKSNG